jgi:hypothetical protein
MISSRGGSCLSKLQHLLERPRDAPADPVAPVVWRAQRAAVPAAASDGEDSHRSWLGTCWRSGGPDQIAIWYRIKPLLTASSS